jgi:hypothetical protein
MLDPKEAKNKALVLEPKEKRAPAPVLGCVLTTTRASVRAITNAQMADP